ncbi:hypothetical protein M569_12591 [Genlisea aurea]|uniref:Uncharacterized protein n=1 Tax=Genlisea aurea TaxID=192259 RepID=S8CCM9_9LAMI|nr:hypothetical protein M569_12591 [Genlisea aurea]
MRKCAILDFGCWALDQPSPRNALRGALIRCHATALRRKRQQPQNLNGCARPKDNFRAVEPRIGNSSESGLLGLRGSSWQEVAAEKFHPRKIFKDRPGRIGKNLSQGVSRGSAGLPCGVRIRSSQFPHPGC